MRSSPPIHTCSEHAQGPSKPPAVVRKLWCLNVSCVWQSRVSCEMTTLEQGLGRRWCGERGGEACLSSGGIAVPEYVCLKAAVTEEALLTWTEFGPPSVGGICPQLHVRACRSQGGSAERRRNIECCIAPILVIARWPRTPSRASVCVYLRSLVFLMVGFWLFLACLDDFAIKMCSLDMNAECLAKSEVFGGWPLL